MIWKPFQQRNLQIYITKHESSRCIFYIHLSFFVFMNGNGLIRKRSNVNAREFAMIQRMDKRYLVLT